LTRLVADPQLHDGQARFHEWLEVMPSDQDPVGADCNHAEGIYGATEFTRRCVAEVLAEKIDAGDLKEEHALRIGKQILRDNAWRCSPTLNDRLWKHKGKLERRDKLRADRCSTAATQSGFQREPRILQRQCRGADEAGFAPVHGGDNWHIAVPIRPMCRRVEARKLSQYNRGHAESTTYDDGLRIEQLTINPIVLPRLTRRLHDADRVRSPALAAASTSSPLSTFLAASSL
jgi:hypothetical protein